MSGKIYLRQPDGALRGMTEAGFDSEEVLQQLIAEYPDLLPGDQIDAASPRKWLLVDRELGVPGEPGGSDRWSLDHLFLDQEGIPTLVEVKRSTDTRLRREVIGQMLDYAANAVAYWPLEDLRLAFENGAAGRGEDPTALIRRHFDAGDGDDPVGAFWEKVKLNLQAHRVRLILVADVIPPELHRVIEFLNEQMDPAEVLGVEIRQFKGEGLQSLVPRVVGQTATAVQQRRSARRPSRSWDESSFLSSLENRAGTIAVEIAQQLQSWATRKGTEVRWRGGAIDGSMVPVLKLPGGPGVTTFTLWDNGSVQMGFEYLKGRPFFSEEANRREFLERLRQVQGLDLPPESHNRRPSFPVSMLAHSERLERFKAVIEWAWDQMRSAAER
jgi:hypothetical protein